MRTIYDEGSAKRELLQTAILRMEKGTTLKKEDVLTVARVTHWLLERYLREHSGGGKPSDT